MFFVAVVWVFMGFVCYKIAAQKGFNKGIWTMLGVLFGVFTLMIELLMPAREVNE